MSFSLNNKVILLTGGTGSFGKAFTKYVLKKYPKIKKLIIFSRDELKQFEMSQEFPESDFPNIRFFLGDIRDKDRLLLATEEVDIIVHAAALKQVPAAEYNPFEFVKTNVIGAQNIIEVSLANNVQKVCALSTDKAASPINLYGATKLCSDKLFISATNIIGKRKLNFCVVRYGNVMGSRGSVIPFFINKSKEGFLPITHEEMTRFNITLQEGVDLVLKALEKSIGGEIFIPKIPSYRILDLAKAISPKAKIKVIGIRSGEKIHEEMLSSSDSLNSVELDDLFVILPNQEKREKYIKKGAKYIKEGFSYTSGKNEDFLTVKQIRELLSSQLDFNL